MFNRLLGSLALGLLAAAMPGYSDAVERELDDAPDDTQELRLDELVAAVLTDNAGLQGLAAAAEAAEYRIAPAGALADPMFTYAGAPETAGGRRGFQERVGLSQTLPWPGKLALREDAARARARADWQSLRDHRLVLTAAAKELFAEWAYIHRTLQIKHAHKDLLAELQRVAETQYSTGAARQQDVLQAAVEEARLDTEIITHQRHRQEVRARINGLLNRAPDSPLPSPAPLPEPVAPPDLPALQALALSDHPALEGLRASIAAAEARHGLAKKDYFPDFRLSAAYNNLWDNSDKRWTVGVTVNLPFDFSNKRDATASAARAEVTRFQWLLTDREAEVLAQLEQGRAQVQKAQEVVSIHRQRLLPLTEDNLAAAVADYRSGRGSFLNVIDAERQQLRTEDNLARAHADYLRALAALERVAGRPLDTAAATSASHVPAGAARETHQQE